MKNLKKGMSLSLFCILLLCVGISSSVYAQQSEPPETILPEEIIKIILNEVSGQLPYNNEVMMSGYNHIRTAEEFEGFFYEGEYLAKKLREYGVDEVRLEDLAQKPSQRTWWVRVDAELWMVKPREKRLSRLAENPALMVRTCDEGEWEGELVYMDRRDVRKLKDMNLFGKIILTPEPIFLFRQAFEKGALGVVSTSSPARNYYDPFQVGFDMGMSKGKTDNKVFGFKIWRHLGDQLKDMLFNGQKVILRATSKTETYPFKADTIFASIKGRNPEKKGFMFTAHLFERPLKQGANDNVSGCVTLAEIARTITALIREGKIERPERSIYFLMGEEGRSTLNFFMKYPEMREKILGVINMDMIGEYLDENYAFFNIEIPPYSKTSFIQSVADNFVNYVFETNVEKHGIGTRTPWIYFPVPIVEKNGSMQPFRYLVNPYTGGSDHQVFNDSDGDVPALSFTVWPDFWYHTDKDRPDKSDPTQLKRIAFIGTACALAVCSGSEEILKNLVRMTYESRLAFIQDAVYRSIKELSGLKESDGGNTYQNAVNYVKESIELSKEAISKIKNLTQSNKKIEDYLASVIKNVDSLFSSYEKHLRTYYITVCKLNNFKSEFAEPSEEEMKLKKMIPVKVDPIKLGVFAPYAKISGAFQKHPEILRDIFQKYGYRYMIELFFSVDGKRDLERIRRMLCLEFKPVPVEDFMKHIKAFEEANLISFNKE